MGVTFEIDIDDANPSHSEGLSKDFFLGFIRKILPNLIEIFWGKGLL